MTVVLSLFDCVRGTRRTNPYERLMAKAKTRSVTGVLRHYTVRTSPKRRLAVLTFDSFVRPAHIPANRLLEFAHEDEAAQRCAHGVEETARSRGGVPSRPAVGGTSRR